MLQPFFFRSAVKELDGVLDLSGIEILNLPGSEGISYQLFERVARRRRVLNCMETGAVDMPIRVHHALITTHQLECRKEKSMFFE